MMELVKMPSGFRMALEQADFKEAEDIFLDALRVLRSRLLALPSVSIDQDLTDELWSLCGMGTSLDRAVCASQIADEGLSALRGQGLAEWQAGYESVIDVVRSLPDGRAANSATVYVTVLDAFVREVGPWIETTQSALSVVQDRLLDPWKTFRANMESSEEKALNSEVERLVLRRAVLPFVRDVARMRSIQLDLRELIDRASMLLQPGRILTAREGQDLALPAEHLLTEARSVLARRGQIEKAATLAEELPGDLASLGLEEEEPPPSNGNGKSIYEPAKKTNLPSGSQILSSVIAGVTTVIVVNVLTKRRRRKQQEEV